MARVFSAVDIEDEKVLQELERIRDVLDLGFNTVSRDKMHITLQFFEDVDSSSLEEVKDATERVSVDPFAAQIKGLGAFPSSDYIRVVWAGTAEEKFRELYEQVSQHGIESSNDHEFRPHVTLARVKNLSPGKKRKLQKSLDEFENHRFGEIEVDRVKLFESRLTGKGSEYRVLHEKEL